jgi:teichuronic acid biosynthesis glycosyltransferase TuaC
LSNLLSTPPTARAPGRLRVLVFTTVFPNSARPLHGTFVLERIKHLAASADIEVIAPIIWYRRLGRGVALPSTSPIQRIAHPKFWYVPRILFGLRGIFLAISAFREVRRAHRRFDFDLIDAHFAYPDGFAAILLGRWFQRPVCITLRGTIIPLSRRPLGRWLCDWAICRAQRVIAVAENLAERARQGGVPATGIVTIGNGVDTERFQLVDVALARRRLGLPETTSLVVSVGHISPRKGFQRVIKALPRVIKQRHDVRLAIIGGRGAEEDNTADLLALVMQLKLSDRVTFTGAKPPGEVALWIAAADVFVLASDFEGCPNVVLEALACGRPVVATKVGDIERMVPNFAGVLFEDPEDDVALANCLTTALERDWDHQRIRGHVLARSWDQVAERVLAQWRLAIDSLAATGAAGPRASEDGIGVAIRSPKA